MSVDVNNKFFYWNKTGEFIYIFYKKGSKIIKTLEKAQFLPLSNDLSEVSTNNHLLQEQLKGFLFEGEKNKDNKKNSLISYFKDNNKILCEIYEVTSENTNEIIVKSLFKFNPFENEYIIENNNHFLYNEFLIKNKIDNKIKFNYLYTKNIFNILKDDEWGNDNIFQKICEDYKNKKYLSRFENIFIN